MITELSRFCHEVATFLLNSVFWLIYTDYLYRLFIQIIYTDYLYGLFIRLIYTTYLYDLFIQLIKKHLAIFVQVTKRHKNDAPENSTTQCKNNW